MNDELELNFRRATEEEQELLLEWANEEETRQQSFQKHQITRAEHEQWFQNALKSENIQILILYFREIPIGSMRFSIGGTEAVLSYSIDCRYRGVGFGKRLIKMASDYARKQIGLTTLKAVTRRNNVASQKILLENGFAKVEGLSNQEGFTFIKDLTIT